MYTVGNPYGFRYNVNHPYINNLYRRFKRWKDIDRPCTEKERFEFEAYLDKMIAGSETPPLS